MGAKSKGNSPNSISPIFTTAFFYIWPAKLQAKLNTGTKLSILIGLSLSGFLLFSLLGYALAMLLFGIELTQFGDISNYRVIQATRFVQALVTLGTFAFPALIFLRIDRTPLNSNGLFSKPNWILFLLAGLLAFSALPFIGWMAEMNLKIQFPEFLSELEAWARELEEKAMIMTEAFLKVDNLGDLGVNLIVIALFPAVCEELLFRGALQGVLIKRGMNYHWAIWITAAAFSFIHMQFFGFFPRMILGALFGYLVVWGGSLWYSIIAHFVNNAVSVLIMFFIEIKYLDVEMEEFGANEGDWVYVLLSIVCATLVTFLFRKKVPTLPNE